MNLEEFPVCVSCQFLGECPFREMDAYMKTMFCPFLLRSGPKKQLQKRRASKRTTYEQKVLSKKKVNLN